MHADFDGVAIARRRVIVTVVLNEVLHVAFLALRLEAATISNLLNISLEIELWCMDFVLEIELWCMDFVLKKMDFVLKVMNFAPVQVEVLEACKHKHTLSKMSLKAEVW